MHLCVTLKRSPTGVKSMTGFKNVDFLSKLGRLMLGGLRDTVGSKNDRCTLS